MLVNKLSCSLCNSRKYRVRFAQLPYRVFQCQTCTLGFLFPVPKEVISSKFYGKKYFENEGKTQGYENYLEIERELQNEAKQRLGIIEKFSSPPKELLDVGTGLGLFADAASKVGYHVEVLDVSSYALDYVKKTYGFVGYRYNLSKPFELKKKFDIVTTWDTLEHVSDIKSCFWNLNQLLVIGGLIFLTTPNLESLDAKLLQGRWYGFTKIPEHLVYYTPQALTLAANQFGLEVLKIERSGFYRSVKFLTGKVSKRYRLLGKLLKFGSKLVRLENRIFYFPLVDMLAVLKKVNNV